MNKYKTINKKSFPVYASKVSYHERKPDKLEVELIKSETGLFNILFGIEGLKYDSYRANIIEIGASEKKAVEEYKKILDKIKKGEYRLHLYSDGKFYIEGLN